MGNTKKVGTTGRFSSRYGVGIKKRVLAVENKNKQPANCSFCGFPKIKRIAPGLYFCNKCEAKFTGGAYETQTLVGKTINKMVSQKQFSVGAEELVKTEESSFSDIEREVEKALSNKESHEEKKSKKKKEENLSESEKEN
jgi:large subunit ribosomal protein L37Ae